MPRSHDRTMANLRLQRRHYQFIADVVREYMSGNSITLAEDFANALRGTNPGFDRARFIEACGEPPTPAPRCLLCQSESTR